MLGFSVNKAFYVGLVLSLYSFRIFAADISPIVLDDNTTKVSIVNKVGVLEDPKKGLTFEQVRQPEFSSKFHINEKPELTYGITHSAYWAKFIVKSKASTTKDFILTIDYVLLDSIDFYHVHSDGTFTHKATGVLTPLQRRDVAHRMPTIRLSLQPQEEQLIYMRFENGGFMTFPLVLWSQSEFARVDHDDQTLVGVLYGILLVMLLYNLLLFATIRDKIYFFYAFFLGVFGLFEAAFSTLGMEYLWPDTLSLTKLFILLGAAGTVFTMLLFSRVYLQTAVKTPRLDKGIKILIIINGLIILACFVGPFVEMLKIGSIATILSLTYVVIISCLTLSQGDRQSVHFLIAFGPFLVAFTTIAIRNVGLIPSSYLIVNGPLLAGVFGTIFLSLGMGERTAEQIRADGKKIKNLFKELQEKSAVISAANEGLEATVAQRTHMITSILDEVKKSSQVLNVDANNAADTSRMLSKDASSQASTLEQISSSMTEMANKVRSSAAHAIKAKELMNSTQSDNRVGNEKVEEMSKAIGEINNSSKAISKIINVIDGLAFQTNILALNAAIEAARAGEHGKGFAVVANEVKNLADRSAQAAQETNTKIDASLRSVSAGAKIAVETVEILNKVKSSIDNMTSVISEIASNADDQAEAIAQIDVAMKNIDMFTQNTAMRAEETSSMSESFTQQVSRLNEIVNSSQQ